MLMISLMADTHHKIPVTFFEDIENQNPEAIALFNKEVEQIYREEGLMD